MSSAVGGVSIAAAVDVSSSRSADGTWVMARDEDSRTQPGGAPVARDPPVDAEQSSGGQRDDRGGQSQHGDRGAHRQVAGGDHRETEQVRQQDQEEKEQEPPPSPAPTERGTGTGHRERADYSPLGHRAVTTVPRPDASAHVRWAVPQHFANLEAKSRTYQCFGWVSTCGLGRCLDLPLPPRPPVTTCSPSDRAWPSPRLGAPGSTLLEATHSLTCAIVAAGSSAPGSPRGW